MCFDESLSFVNGQIHVVFRNETAHTVDDQTIPDTETAHDRSPNKAIVQVETSFHNIFLCSL